MRIGRFSKKFNVSVDTVRYYIALGLLIPEKKASQYHFDQTCVEDMNIITELKYFRFSLQEIHKVLSIKRITNFGNEDDNFYINFLLEKKQNLMEENKQIYKVIHEIDEKIKKMSNPTPLEFTTGVPLSFVPLLHCPMCQYYLQVKEAELQQKFIIEAKLICQCGYQAKIHEGILITPFQHTTSQNQYFIYGSESMSEVTPSFINLLEKCGLWIYRKLLQEDLSNHVVIETNVDVYVFLPKYLQSLHRDTRYVFTGNSIQMLKKLKAKIEYINPNLDVLYILNGDLTLPLLDHSIDIVIDSLSFNDFSLFHNSFPLAKMSRYLKNSTKIIGTFLHYQENSKSIKKLKMLYQDTYYSNLSSYFIEENIKEFGFQVIEKEHIGYTKEPGEYIDYHTDNEKINLSVYVAGFATQ